MAKPKIIALSAEELAEIEREREEKKNEYINRMHDSAVRSSELERDKFSDHEFLSEQTSLLEELLDLQSGSIKYTTLKDNEFKSKNSRVIFETTPDANIKLSLEFWWSNHSGPQLDVDLVMMSLTLENRALYSVSVRAIYVPNIMSGITHVYDLFTKMNKFTCLWPERRQILSGNE